MQAKNDDELVKNEGRLEQACASKEYVLETAGGRADRKAKSEFEGVLSIVKTSRAQFQLPERPKETFKRIVRAPIFAEPLLSVILCLCDDAGVRSCSVNYCVFDLLCHSIRLLLIAY